VIGCDVSDHVTHGSHNTNDPRAGRDLVNGEPQLANSLHQSYVSNFEKHLRMIRV